ncbi:Nuclear pore Nup98 component, partial [Tubulinosema ratisbonensis]
IPGQTNPVTPQSTSSNVFIPGQTQAVPSNTTTNPNPVSSNVFTPQTQPISQNIPIGSQQNQNTFPQNNVNTFTTNPQPKEEISSLTQIKNVSLDEINKTIPFSVKQKSFEEIVENLKLKLENDINDFRKKALEVYKLDDKLINLRNEYVRNVKLAEEEIKLLKDLEENLEFYNNYVEENEVVEGNLINEIESLVDEVNNVICSVEDEDDEAKKLISENMKLIRFIDNELSKLGG